jgi:hypothetical protein
LGSSRGLPFTSNFKDGGGGLRELPSADGVDNSGIQVEERAALMGQMQSSGGKLKIPGGFFKKKGA